MPTSLRSTYDRIAGDFHKDHLNDHWSNLRVQVFAGYLQPGGRVLDVGCGTGIKSRLLADAGLDVLGTDFSQGMIDEARRNYPDIRFDVLDIREVGTLPDAYDGILAFAVLLHLPKAETPGVVASLASRLKPGGVLMVAIKTMGADRVGEKVVTEDDYGYSYERFFSFYTGDEMRGYLRDAGLLVCYDERFPPTGKSWTILIAQRP